MITSRQYVATNAASTVATFGSTTLANSLIVVFIDSFPATANISAITDNVGNTYSLVIRKTSGGFPPVEIWVCLAPTSGVTDITVAVSGQSNMRIYAVEIIGAGGWTLGDSDSAAATPASTIQTPALTISSSSVVLAGLTAYNGGNTITAGSGFTMISKSESGALTDAFELGVFSSDAIPAFSLSGSDFLVLAAAAFTAVTDVTPPTVQTIQTSIDGATVILQMSEDIEPSSSITGFSVWQNSSSVSISSVTRSGTDVIVLTPSVALSPATTLEYAYSGGNVQDEAGNNLATITRQSFTNLIADPTATVTYLDFTLYFNKPWSASGTYVDGTPYRVRSASDTYCVAMTPTPIGSGDGARHSIKKNPDYRRKAGVEFTAAWQDGRMQNFVQAFRDEDVFPILIDDDDTLMFTESIILPDATAITDATDANPIVITSTGHGLVTGDHVIVASVGGNAAANGTWPVTVTDANTFSLDGTTGNGSYTSGGTVQKLYFFGTSSDPEGLPLPARYFDSSWINPDSGANSVLTMIGAGIINFPATAPGSSAFRPPFMGSTKPTFLTSQANFGILAKDNTNLGLSVSDLERAFLRPQFGIALNNASDEFQVLHSDIPNYGRDWMYVVQEAAFVITSDASNSTKQKIFYALIQMGIDLYYSCVIEPGMWTSNGGFKDGRSFPVLLAKLALGQSWDTSGFTFSERTLTYDGDAQSPVEDLYTGWQSSGNPKAKNVLRALGGVDHYEGQPFSEWQNIGTVGSQPWNRPEGYERLVSYSLVGLLMAMCRIRGMRAAYNYESSFWYVDRWMNEIENSVTSGRPDTLMAAAAVTYGWNAIDTEGDWENPATYNPKQGATLSDKAQIVYSFMNNPIATGAKSGLLLLLN